MTEPLGATAAVSSHIRFNGPLGAGNPALQRQWLPGTLHLSIRNAHGPDMARGLAVRPRCLWSLHSHMGCIRSVDVSTKNVLMCLDTRKRSSAPCVSPQEEQKLFISAGVSCHQGKAASGTLLAMGITNDWAAGSLRISMGRLRPAGPPRGVPHES